MIWDYSWKIPTMKYIVTGGVGFIGLHLSEHLILQGQEVVIIDNLGSSI